MKKKKNRHVGSTFESWLDETGLREGVTVGGITAVVGQQPAIIKGPGFFAAARRSSGLLANIPAARTAPRTAPSRGRGSGAHQPDRKAQMPLDVG